MNVQWCEYKGDALDHRYYDNAERIGQSAAEWISSGNLPVASEQVLEYVEQFQVNVIIVPVFSKLRNPKVRAIYDHHRRLIAVQEDSLLFLKETCEAAGLGPVGRVDMLAIHVAHELFHHLEETGKVAMSAYYQLKDLSVWRRMIARLYNGPSLLILREIAAHSFVTRLLGLSVSPAWLEHARPNLIVERTLS
jgi:hypothetical protein